MSTNAEKMNPIKSPLSFVYKCYQQNNQKTLWNTIAPPLVRIIVIKFAGLLKPGAVCFVLTSFIECLDKDILSLVSSARVDDRPSTGGIRNRPTYISRTGRFWKLYAFYQSCFFVKTTETKCFLFPVLAHAINEVHSMF